ncbi:glutamine synthetase family protein [Candidatus Riflebacteria bacterium]
MKQKDLSLNPDRVAIFLKKEASQFTREDIIKFIKENEIRMLNFNYVAGDGRLKTLSFAIRNEMHLRQLLDWGERVDGSSLFSYIDTAHSDVYVIPRFKTAFLNPFSPIPTLNMLCSYFDENGNELDISPEYIVHKAQKVLQKRTGISLYAFGELEYYAILKNQEEALFPGIPQKNYHESKPFVKCEDMNNEILFALSSIGARVKYGHSEVGSISFEDGFRFEQYEIELDLEPIEDMADHLVIAKWLIRNIAARYGIEITFAPKISVGHAGSGLHIHFAAYKEGKNILLDKNFELSQTARKIIGGILKLAPSLTAFGNTNPTSYLRLVPDQEAPTNICWGDRNRSGLIRVPLGWRNISNLSSLVNRGVRTYTPCDDKQTIELRSPDGSANVYLLLAGMAVAAKYGLLNIESLKLAEECYIDVNIFKREHKKILQRLAQLPRSCFESAESLKSQAEIYEQDKIFSKRVIAGIEQQLKVFEDKNLNERLKKNRKKAQTYIKDFLHWG